MWTRFMDMHSGGGLKEEWDELYIKASSEEEASLIFYNRFKHNPERVSCTCCGPDYNIDSYPTLKEATAYDRNCDYVCKKDKNGRRIEAGFYIEAGEEIPEGYEEDGFKWSSRTYSTLEDYVARENVLVIKADEVWPEERSGSIPSQGYVWVD